MGLWALLGVIAWITKYFPGKYNNFSIFRQSFWHTLNELPLYAAYPEEYNDIFHYGPVFSLVVAPFAITPLWLGLLTWSVAQSLFLFWAIKMLPGIKRERIFIYWFCAHELLTSLFMSQFNISIAAIIVLAYVLIEKYNALTDETAKAELKQKINDVYGILSETEKAAVVGYAAWNAVANA